MIDEWIAVPGHAKYEVSQLGNVRRKKNGRRLTASVRSSKSKYLAVCLTVGHNKTKTCLVHRLVASAFLPNPEDKPQVNHKDGNKKNNALENLEWVTESENTRHSFDVLGKQPIRNPNKLTAEDVLKIRALCKTDMKQREIARAFNVCRETICYINKGKTWAHI